uniref:Uncharacterized protein n=1 Tax=Candidatus Kentrum sp. TC TaxID=2126339 RepID=A0A450YZX3_9GAMM|nr:MAG: hypothetical protein BECKTC1821E_GA0114239_10776 [Candidatus Kentron sp. TC]
MSYWSWASRAGFHRRQRQANCIRSHFTVKITEIRNVGDQTHDVMVVMFIAPIVYN